jgi:hypothetical protein
MRRLSDVTCFTILAGKDDKHIKLSDLMPNFAGSVSRLPIVDAESRPKYMLHQSRIDQYIAGGGNLTVARFARRGGRVNAIPLGGVGQPPCRWNAWRIGMGLIMIIGRRGKLP